MLYYNSTRNKDKYYTPSYCIVKGLSEDSGLFVPSDISGIKFDLNYLKDKKYTELAFEILKAFLPDFSNEQLKYCIKNAYNSDKFENDNILSMHNTEDFSILELFTGRTIAFKDVALSILPYLLKCAKDNLGIKERIVILTATSGDTGKAALEGFASAPETDVIVFYPYRGVSRLQLLQMLTQKGDNVTSFAVKGNFDDTQTGVKEIFNDKNFNELLKEKGIILSSANSINIGRLLPQIVYYFFSYFELVKEGKISFGDKINFVVPTGNFGDILAGYYAKQTGLPINKLICASNENNVLYDFFKGGKYNKNRPFKKTIAPSMDILISSNLERLIYHINNDDDKITSSLMKDLKEKGYYKISEESYKKLDEFIGEYSSEDDLRKAIKDCYEKYNYLIDTHTAAGYNAYTKYVNENDDKTYTVLLSTASPYKFSKDVYKSIFTDNTDFSDDVEYMYELNKKTNVAIPKAVNKIETLKRKEEKVIEKDMMKKSVLDYIERKEK